MRTSITAYRDAAPLYLERGFKPHPVPANAKQPPQQGTTGYSGEVTDEQVMKWRDDRPSSNVALRAEGWIGIDVDVYTDKHGDRDLADLVKQVGEPLPATWSSTARGVDSPSRQYLYGVLPQLRFASKIGNDVEVIQRSHRYMVAWPSVHPTGEQYRWYYPDGTLAPEGVVPDLDTDIPDLPTAYVDYLTREPDVNMLTDVNAVGWRALRASFTPAGTQDECLAVTRLRQSIEDARADDGHLGHDDTQRLAGRAFMLGREGHRGVDELLDDLFRDAQSYVAKLPGRQNDVERGFESAANWAQHKAVTSSCRCDDPTMGKSLDFEVEQDDEAAARLALLLNASLMGGPRGDRLLLAPASAQLRHRNPMLRYPDSKGVNYVWADGRWKADNAEPYAFAFLQEKLTASEYSHGKLDDLKRYAALEAGLVDDSDIDTRYISLANGLLDWETFELIPRTVDIFAPNTSPIAWNPDATPGRIAEWMASVYTPEQLPHIWEIIGYALAPLHDQKVALALTGPGGGGKSTFINLVSALVGYENTTAVPPSDLKNAVTLAYMHGRTLNAAGDVGAEEMKYLGPFKSVVAGDLVTANPKFEPVFRYRPRHFHMAAFNVMPNVQGDTAFWDRWIVVEHTKRFGGDGRLPDNYWRDGMHKDQHAMEGALVLAVEGYQRMRKRGGFDATVFAAAKEKWRSDVDDITGFVTTHVTANPLGEVTGKGLYDLYRTTCLEDGRDPKSKQEFGKGIEAWIVERGLNAHKALSPSRVVTWVGLQAIVQPGTPQADTTYGKRGWTMRVA